MTMTKQLLAALPLGTDAVVNKDVIDFYLEAAIHREPEMGVIFPYAFEVLIGRNKAYV